MMETKMGDILVLVEHRRGAVRDITFEIMAFGRYLAAKTGGKLTAVILGDGPEKLVEALKPQAHRVMVVDAPVFKHFNSASYQKALAEIIKKEQPGFTLMGHTAFGMDLCPTLATYLDVPFTTDCIGIDIEGGQVKATRQVYDGKLNATVRLREGTSYMLTLRSGTFPAGEAALDGEVVGLDSPLADEPAYRRFIEYIEPVVGDVDITRSDIVVGVGRGVKEKDNIAMVEEFAAALGGVVGCTRPVVDNEWMPKDRQIGSSGKTIKPKLYIALGVSGAFQHVAGMKGADTIIAVNKDPKAPIFNEADYGIVGDMFKILPVLKEKIIELKA
jgi:electron transfer flavoprotein alpha subunit